MSIHDHNYGPQKSDPNFSRTSSSTAKQIDRLKANKADFDRQLTALCRQLAQMVNDIESLRSLNDQLFRASVNQVMQQQNQQRDQSSEESSAPVESPEPTPSTPSTPTLPTSPRRLSAESNSSESSKMSFFSSTASTSVSTSTDSLADDALDQLSLSDIDQLPALQLNYFINLLYEAAVSGAATGKDNFLDAFELLCRQECCEVIQQNGVNEDDTEEESPEVQESEATESTESSSDSESYPVVQCVYGMPDVHGDYSQEPEPDYVESDGEEDVVFIDSDDVPNMDEQEMLSSPSVYEDSYNQSFVTADDGDSDASSLVDDIEVTIPESPKEKSTGSSPTNSSSAVSSASCSPSSEDQDGPATMINTEAINIPERQGFPNLKKRSSSFNLHSSSSSTISSSPPSETSTFSEPPLSPLAEPQVQTDSNGQKTVQIKGYDETGKETFERVVLRSVHRSKTFASPQTRPTVTIRDSTIAETPKSPENTETMSFANRRNMWERRSLGRGYKYRAGA